MCVCSVQVCMVCAYCACVQWCVGAAFVGVYTVSLQCVCVPLHSGVCVCSASVHAVCVCAVCICTALCVCVCTGCVCLWEFLCHLPEITRISPVSSTDELAHIGQHPARPMAPQPQTQKPRTQKPRMQKPRTQKSRMQKPRTRPPSAPREETQAPAQGSSRAGLTGE